MTLQELLDAIAAGDQDALAAALSGHVDLSGLEVEAVATFDRIRAGDGLTEDDVAALETLASAVEALRGEQTRRAEAAAEQQARIDEIAGRITPAAAEVDPSSEVDGQPDPTAGADGGEGTGHGPDGGLGVPDVVEVEPIAASAIIPPQRRGRVDLTAVARRTAPPTPPPDAGRRPAGVLVAAADVPHTQAGSRYESIADVAAAAQRRFGSMPGTSYDGRYQAGIAVVQKDFPPELDASNGADHMEVLTRAASESRLKDGSLLAAGGWCAPSETLYELCELESTDGLLSIPEVMASRGGIRWTMGPDFASIFSNTGFIQTEAQADAGTTKPCFEVPCPDFDECRLDAIGVCVSAGILTNRAYPELIARFLRGALAAHAHRYSGTTIARIAAGSTAVAIPAGLSATSTVLGALELQGEDYRYRHRMPRESTLEVIAPFWLRGVLRSDWMKRNGCCEAAVADAEIARWFRVRGYSVQWVYNWQDALFPAGTIGGAVPATAWPATVQLLMYAAGTWVRATSDIITLDAVYDSTLFRTNRYNALFTEEGLCVLQLCHDSRLLTIPICPNGATGEQVAVTCPTV